MLMHIFPLIDALHNTCHFLKPHRSPNLTNRLFICRLHPDLKLYQSRTHRLNQLQFFFIQQIRRHFKMKIRDPFVMLLDIFPNGNRMLMVTVKSSIHKLHLRHFLIDKKLKLFFYQFKFAETQTFVYRRKAVTAGKRTSSARLIVDDLILKICHIMVHKRNLTQIHNFTP